MSFLKSFYQAVLDFFFPRRCPMCDLPVLPMGALICKECRPKVHYIRAPYCMKCGKSLDAEQVYCRDCLSTGHVFERGLSLYDYRSVAISLHRFKYQGRQEYAAFYGEEIARYLGAQILSWRPDAIVPIPIHRKRRHKRGYNQAELLAKEIGVRLQIPVRQNLIMRCENTIPQKELSRQARQKNLENAFKLLYNDVKLETIVIVDDIYTTGSTVDAVAALFYKSGVRHVYVVTLSIGRG